MKREPTTNDRKPVISLSMIVRNEEKFLEGCLESVRDVVDEIVIVDTGSTDGTRDIAVRYGATVISCDWSNDFSAARNEGLRNVRGAWVLYLDADERLAPGAGAILREAVKNNTSGGFRLMVCGKTASPSGVVEQRNPYPRLFRNHPLIRFQGKVHEQIGPSILKAGFAILDCPVTIHHLGYSKSESINQQKALRNLTILQQEVGAHPEDWYLRFQKSATLMKLGAYEDAKGEMKQALQFGDVPPGMKATMFNFLAEIECRTGSAHSALQYCQSSLRLAPDQIMAHWYLVSAWMRLGRHDNALVELQLLVDQECGSSDLQTIGYDVVVPRSEILIQIGACREARKEFDLALDAYLEVLQLCPDAPEALEGIAGIHPFLSNRTHAIEALQEALQKHSSSGIRLVLAGMYRNCRDVSRARAYLVEALESDPKTPAPYELMMKWALDDNDLQQAAETYHGASENGVTSVGLVRASVDLALRTKDYHAALVQIQHLIPMIPKDSPVKQQIEALAEKLSARFTPQPH